MVAAFTIASRKWNPVYGAIVTPGTVLAMQPHLPRDVTVTSATWFHLVDHVANDAIVTSIVTIGRESRAAL